MAREFLQLAHVYDPERNNPAAWFMSAKLDGMRCYFDGGITRGLLTTEIPWANTTKDARYISPIKSTGLWSRYGKAIQAPNWLLDQLPTIPLDGELWMGNMRFQRVMSTVKQLVPDNNWRDVQYKVFDAPSYLQMFSNGEIKLKKKFEKKFVGILPWIEKRNPHPDFLNISRTFMEVQNYLKGISWSENVKLHAQVMLSFNMKEAKEQLEEAVTHIVAQGGEGVMLRNPTSLWSPSRVRSLLKYKPTQDSEGTVVGFTWGRETDLGSKLLGKMGALIVEWRGKRFKLSGFTDEEREISGPGAFEYGSTHQGEENENPELEPKWFPYKNLVTFTYRELTDDGVPKEARFHRKYIE